MVAFELVALACCFVVVLRMRECAFQTSLVGCWSWLLIAVICLLLGVITRSATSVTSIERDAFLWVTNTAVFCPTVSLFGARRPQHRGWNFIVLTLWGVLAMPAAEAIFAARADRIDIHVARWCFIWVVIGAGWLNHVFTRFTLAASCFAAAQLLLFKDQLLPSLPFRAAQSTALALLACGALATTIVAIRPRSDRSWQRVLLDFRDLFGAIWALRLAERLNAAARTSGWTTRLRWQGPTTPIEDLDPVQQSSVETCLRAYLRRFVDDEWIEPRLG